ncbi:hypothetical protein PMIN07_010265 [Paraphaeosphaeria minitans]
MSHQRRAADPRLVKSRSGARVDEHDDDRREANAGESVEFSQDDISPHGLPGYYEHRRPASHCSDSPLFEPMETVEPEHEDLLDDETAALEATDEEYGSSYPPHDTTFDGLKRARDIKNQITGKTLKILAPKPKHVRARTVEEDPDNQAIKVMRQEHSMTWDAIVTELNKKRLERGEPRTWTSAAVYSRFVRNAPRIAAAKGEYGFRPQDYMHLRNPQSHPAAQLPGAINNSSGYLFGAGGGRKRVRDADHAAKDLADNLRQPVSETLIEQTEILKTADMTELMMEAVATVEQEFWGTVANALEKKTGKLFDAKVLESRFHEIK